MAGTYVDITREEFEDWLDSTKFRGKWKLREQSAGVYLVRLSKNVGIRINSTVGRSGRVKQKAGASAKFALVSLVNGRVLNKKAQGQAYFARTTNWRKNWLKGLKNMEAAYLKSQNFYEGKAVIDPGEEKALRKDFLTKIEAVVGWKDNSFLSDIHKKLMKGATLTQGQRDAVDRVVAAMSGGGGGRRPQEKARLTPQQEAFLQRVRNLYQIVNRQGSDWEASFVDNVGRRMSSGHSLSPRQRKTLGDLIRKYRV